MKKTLSFLVVWCLCIGVADAALRATNSNTRGTNTVQSRNTPPRGNTASVSPRTNTSQSRNVSGRPTNTVQRVTVSRKTTPAVTTRTPTASRAATTVAARNTKTTNASNVARTVSKTSRISRAATVPNSFGAGYNSCRDAYFTCMDQFCAAADDTYRRCICSSRLDEIKSKQRALDAAADQIQNFKDLNIEVIPKTPAEVNAMLTATKGEYAASVAIDNSDSAKKLAGISAVLNQTKSKSLSTAGTLDIAGNINSIWATTNLASGTNIANLTGETLYNAVHSQCAELVAQHCESRSTLNMVVSAYGMYIENDCTLLSNALGKQKTNANTAIRETEREMHSARLENYNAHNSTSINDCVAKVRADITSENACGSDYVHCLDVSGLYLNKTTGEPIYSENFYQLETMVSLSGDVLTNQTNRLLVAELNRKRGFAEKSLSTCQDLADDVWDEFMRQAVTEIYQGQQTRIRKVKDECLDVVNQCYDKQSASLRDFSNTNEQLLLGTQLELSEQLCQEKLVACSNLYGGGSRGMQELIDTMRNITSQKIAKNCLTTLQEYATSICAVPSSDTLHSYPYACRVYAPGEQKYAMMWKCQNQSKNKNKTSIYTVDDDTGGDTPSTSNGDTDNGLYSCPLDIIYTSCQAGYYLSNCGTTFGTTQTTANPEVGNSCEPCPSGMICDGGVACPYTETTPDPDTQEDNVSDNDGCDSPDYVGSLYQQIVRYALQACMRPSEIKVSNSTTVTPISNTVLQDVNTTMDSIRIAMSNALQAECERLDGYWVPTPYDEESTGQNTSASNLELWTRFYEETGANTKWGYCANKDAATEYYGTINNNDNNGD